MVARTLDAWRLTSPTCGSPSPTCRSRRARGAGSPRPTASSTSTSPRASRSRPPATATRRCRPRSRSRPQRFIHAQVNCYHHDLLEPLADRLAEITPASIDTFFYANSGAEITEAAVKLAKQVTGRPHVIVFSGSFHGRTHLTMAMTTSKAGYRAGHAPLPPGIFVAPFPDPLAPDTDAEIDRALAGLDHLLAAQTAPAETAAMIIEPVLGEGGYVPAPARFLQGLAARCAAARHPVRRRRSAVRVRAHRRDVRGDARGHRARRVVHGQGHRVRLPVLRARRARRAHGPLAEGEPRRHVRRQPDGLRGGARLDRGADRARLPRERPARAASSSRPG